MADPLTNPIPAIQAPFATQTTTISLSDAALKELNSQLAAIPSGKRGALLAIADQNGVRAQLAAKINDNWELAGEVGREWTGPITGQVMVQGSW